MNNQSKDDRTNNTTPLYFLQNNRRNGICSAPDAAARPEQNPHIIPQNHLNYQIPDEEYTPDDNLFDGVGYSEYEALLNGCDDDKVVSPDTGKAASIRDNPPTGDASNVHQQANQSTSKTGRTMYENDTSTPTEGVPPTPLMVRINEQYLGDSVAKACERWRFLAVRSDKGTGKTYAMSMIIAPLDQTENILFISPRKKLNYALAKDLGLSYYEDVKKADKDMKREMARRMVITPQSLGAILADFPDIRYRYVVMDESESVADTLVSSVTKSKQVAIKALKAAAAGAGNVVLMDAAYGERSECLMGILSGGEKPGKLVNDHKRWRNIHCDVLSGGKYTDRVEASNALQIEALKQGQRIAISSSSATYCELRHDVLSQMFPALRIGLFTSNTGDEVKAVLNNPEKAGEYDILIFSPAVSIGVSFNIKDHFNVVYGVYPNVLATGDSDDAVQGMARIRHPANNHWVVVLDDEKQVYRNADAFQLPGDIQSIISKRYLRDSFFAGCPVQVTAEDDEIAGLYAVCLSYHAKNKNNFSECFRASLASSGVCLVNLDHSGINADTESEQHTEQAKEARKERTISAKTTSAKLDEMGYERLKAKVKYRSGEVTNGELDSMARYRFERKFDIDCDQLTPERLDYFLTLDDQDAISQCINREIALSDKTFTKEYLKARIIGVGGSDAFKVDLVDEKLSYRLKKKLLDYASAYFDGGEYSHASLKADRSMVRFIERNYQEIVITSVIPLPKNWSEKPALIMNHLLSMCGYGHRVHKGFAKGKRERVYESESVPAINQLCLMRAEKRLDWISGTKRLIGLHEEILKSVEGRTRLEKLWIDCGRTDDMGAFLLEFADDIQDIESGVYTDDVLHKIVANWA